MFVQCSTQDYTVHDDDLRMWALEQSYELRILQHLCIGYINFTIGATLCLEKLSNSLEDLPHKTQLIKKQRSPASSLKYTQMQQTIQPLGTMQIKVVSKRRYIVAGVSIHEMKKVEATAHLKHAMTCTIQSCHCRWLTALTIPRRTSRIHR